MPTPLKPENRYSQIIEKIFFDHYSENATTVSFERDEIISAAKVLGFPSVKNPGDVIYAMRYRTPLPKKIRRTEPEGREWIIAGEGAAKYVFRLAPISRIAPNPNLITVKLPDATPEIIRAYALSDEQALLAKVRYNRLIDLFLGIAAYSLQSHLRTSVASLGQIEIDELYAGVDRLGRQFIIPVQAKGGSDRLSPVQAAQDIACCAEKFPSLICRAISAQFVGDDRIAIFELTLDADQIKVVDEKHYQLVPAKDISAKELQTYRDR